MSLDYDFEIKTSLSPKDVSEILAKFHNTSIDDERYNSFRITGTTIGAIEYKDKPDFVVEKYLDGFSFFPNVRVDFTQVVQDGFELSQQSIAKSVAELFKKTKGKAVFLFDYDKTIAQRLNGDLIEIHIEGDEDYADYYDWLVEEFDKAGLNYVRRVLPSPLQM
ncbi:MAG: SitI3 family protein [Pyrinomonadaceae bacterium]